MPGFLAGCIDWDYDPQIEITSPNGGEEWTVGTQQTIAWESEGVEGVWFQLSRDGGSTWEGLDRCDLDISYPPTGERKWTVDDGGLATPQGRCLVRVLEAGGSACDQSDATFSIVSSIEPEPHAEVEPSSLEFVARVGGEDPAPKTFWFRDPLDPVAPHEASATADWLAIEPVPLGQDVDSAYPYTPVPPNGWDVFVTVQGLPEGEHHAEIEVTDADGFVVATVPVTLTISPGPRPHEPCNAPDTFEAFGVVRAAPEKWASASGGRITHVLEGVGIGRTVVTGSVCNVHLEMIPEGAKLRLSAGSPWIAEALAASEGRRVIVSGNLPQLRAVWDADGPVPPEGEVTGLQALVTSVEAYGDVVPASSVASLWGEDTVPPGATHALVNWIEMPPQPWPPGFYPELPLYPFIVHYFLRPAATAPDLAGVEGLSVRVEGDLLGVGDNLTVGPRIICVSGIEEVSQIEPDRISGAVGKVSSPGVLRVNPIVTEYCLSEQSPVDLAGLDGEWVEVSGEVTGGYGSTLGRPAVSVLTLAIDSAIELPPDFDCQDHVRLLGEVKNAGIAGTASPSAATHSLVKHAGPLLPAFWTAAHLRSDEPGALEQWENCTVFVEGTVDSWITWEGEWSFGALVNVTAVGPPPPDIDDYVPPPETDPPPCQP